MSTYKMKFCNSTMEPKNYTKITATVTLRMRNRRAIARVLTENDVVYCVVTFDDLWRWKERLHSAIFPCDVRAPSCNAINCERQNYSTNWYQINDENLSYRAMLIRKWRNSGYYLFILFIYSFIDTDTQVTSNREENRTVSAKQKG